MSDIERAIQDLVRETIESDVDIPTEEDIEKMIAAEYEDRLERDIKECLDSERVVRTDDLNALKAELLRAIESRTVRHQAGALKDKFKRSLVKLFTGRVKNGRKVVCLWTLLF